MSTPGNDAPLEVVGDYLWDGAFAKAVDELSSTRFHLSAAVLMEIAGKSVADWMLDAELVDAPIIVLAGCGHNGADALVAARWLAESGAEVHTFLVPSSTKSEPSGLCAQQLQTLRLSGFNAETYRPGCLAAFRKAEPVILDGIYGLGFKGELASDSLAVQALKEARRLPDATVVAIDVPSGLNCDNGDEQRLPLPADVTLTFGAKKPGLVLAPARDGCGEVIALPIGLPGAARDELLKQRRPAFLLPDAQALLEVNPWDELPKSAHKYDRGHVLIIGGSVGKTGAPLLSGMSALRAGAGWVSLALPKTAHESLRGDVPRELVFEALFNGDDLDSLALAKFLKERRVAAVVIGPGMMTTPLNAAVMAELAEFTAGGKGFVVLDAGAMTGAAALLKGHDLDPERWLLTPHPGEWIKMLGKEHSLPAPLNQAAVQSARELAAGLGVTLMYKGATPVVISAPADMPAFVADEGTRALARAGSGDLLAGAAGAHGAIGLSAVITALRAQTLIAWAARLAAEKVGEHAVVAKDILEHMGKVADHVADSP